MPPATPLQSSAKTQTNCLGPGAKLVAPKCVDTAFVSTQLATATSTFASPDTFNTTAPTNQTFTSTFGLALKAQASLKGWTLVNGGTLDLTINIDSFSANLVNNRFGGMKINAVVSKYDPRNQPDLKKGVTAPTASQLVWTQAIYMNWQPSAPANGAPTPAKPANTLDDYTFNTGGKGMAVAGAAGAFGLAPQAIPSTAKNAPYSTVPANAPSKPQQAYADPLYPFQSQRKNGINTFSDEPFNAYTIPASFRGIALLSAVNTQTKTLTVFNDGINYGFDLEPIVAGTAEPSFTVLSGLVISGMLIALRRRKNP
ncbi:MAG TPA: hypothetical protein VKB79_26265 [Bryobacteraceae bacterium]|nr:hypothetical protein [Bryobacteraceae bacterium]